MSRPRSVRARDGGGKRTRAATGVNQAWAFAGAPRAVLSLTETVKDDDVHRELPGPQRPLKSGRRDEPLASGFGPMNDRATVTSPGLTRARPSKPETNPAAPISRAQRRTVVEFFQ